MLSEITMLVSSLGDYLLDEMTHSNESTREVFTNEIKKLETNVNQFHEESKKKSDEILSLLQKQELSEKEFQPLIKNKCRCCDRKKNGRFDTCCQACINGSHTADCHRRNECKRNDKTNDKRNKSIDDMVKKNQKIYERKMEAKNGKRNDRRNKSIDDMVKKNQKIYERKMEAKNDKTNDKRNKSIDDMEITSSKFKQPEIQEEQQSQKKNQITQENDEMKIRQILFKFHYEHSNCETRHHYKVFKCIFCKEGMITRDEFKVVRLGYDYGGQAGPNHISHILPVCLNCDGHRRKKNRQKNDILQNLRHREEHVEAHNLVSSDERLFIHNNIDIINTFPLV
jgi:hypothetical protein